MAQAGGSVRGSAGATVRATYHPQGVVPADGALRDFTATAHANDTLTTLEHGTGPGTIDHATVSDRAIPAGSSVTWDLYTGTDLKGPAGETCAFRLVRQVKISVVDGGESGVRVGGAASDEWVGYFEAAGDSLDIWAGGPPFWVGDPEDGVAVTSGAKNLKVENLSTTEQVIVRVLVAGSVFNSGMAMGPVGLTYP